MVWCDFYCEWADVETTEAVTGGCRREIAIYCRKFQKLVLKNALCIEDKRKLLAQDHEYQQLFGKPVKE